MGRVVKQTELQNHFTHLTGPLVPSHQELQAAQEWPGLDHLGTQEGRKHQEHHRLHVLHSVQEHQNAHRDLFRGKKQCSVIDVDLHNDILISF